MRVVAKDVWKNTFGEMVDISIQSMVAMDAPLLSVCTSHEKPQVGNPGDLDILLWHGWQRLPRC